MRSQVLSTTATTTTSSHSTRSASRSSRVSKRSVTLWTLQGALGITFLFAGVSKLVMPADQLTADTSLPVLFLRFIGVCETLGGIGLVLPGVLRIHRALTPLAAAGLIVIMVGAVVVTVAAGDGVFAAIPGAVGVLAGVVCYCRHDWASTNTTGHSSRSARQAA